MKVWGVRFHNPHRPVGPRVRECESRDHARAVLAGLPPHYLPAHVVTRVGGRWRAYREARADERERVRPAAGQTRVRSRGRHSRGAPNTGPAGNRARRSSTKASS